MFKKVNGITYNPPRITDNRTTSGVTSETILLSVLVPAKTFQTLDIVGIQSRVRKVTTLGSFIVRLRIGPTENTSQTLCGTFSSATTTNTYLPFNRRLSIQNVINDTKILPATANTNQDISSANSVPEDTVSIDWTVDNYLIITGQSSSASEEVNCAYIITDVIYSVSPT